MQTFFIIVSAVVVVSLIWRFASNRYSLPCPFWLTWLIELDNPLLRNNRAEAIINGLGVLPGMTVLDVGCGPGRVAIPLARTVGLQGKVICLDLQTKMLERVRSKAEEAGLSNLEFHKGDISASSLQDESYDRAVLATVLGEIPDKSASLSAIFALLKPCGVLAITEVVADPHFQPRSRVIGLAKAVGFEELSRTGSKFSYTIYFQKRVPEDETCSE